MTVAVCVGSWSMPKGCRHAVPPKLHAYADGSCSGGGEGWGQLTVKQGPADLRLRPMQVVQDGEMLFGPRGAPQERAVHEGQAVRIAMPHARQGFGGEGAATCRHN